MIGTDRFWVASADSRLNRADSARGAEARFVLQRARRRSVEATSPSLARAGQRLYHCTSQPEVIFPPLRPWVEQPHDGARCIDRTDIGALEPIADHASVGEIVSRCFATVLPAHDVVDFV